MINSTTVKIRISIARIIVLLCVMMTLVGCNRISQGKTTENYVYITYQTYHEWQIWKIAIDGSTQELIYRLPIWVTMGSSSWDDLFVEEIKQQIIKEYENSNDQILFKTRITVSMSPDKRLMAIKEIFSRFPLNYDDGQTAVTVINIETHEEICKYVSRQPINDLTWSSDSTLLAFDQLEKPYKAGFETIHIWNIQTAQEILIESGESPEFIGYSHKILFKNYYDRQETNKQDLSCCKILDASNGTVEKKSIVETIPYNPYHKYSLSSDGKKIALEIPLENSIEVQVIDFDNLNFESTIFSSDIESLIWKFDWSSDDKLLAIEEHKNNRGILEIMDSQSGDVLYSLEEVVDWQWSSKNQKLLYFTQNVENSCFQTEVRISVLDIQEDQIVSIELPEAIRDFMDSNEEEIICIQYIHEVTW